MHRGKTELKDWYRYHDMCARELRDKAEIEALNLLDQTLLKEHLRVVLELESQIETGTEDVGE